MILSDASSSSKALLLIGPQTSVTHEVWDGGGGYLTLVVPLLPLTLNYFNFIATSEQRSYAYSHAREC